MNELNRDKIRAVIDTFSANEDFIRDKWSGMTFLEGVTAALEWVLGEQTDEDFFGELPDRDSLDGVE